ncbi:MAG: SRPBCC domain-containing protein [Saprospiraceae bacterium]
MEKFIYNNIEINANIHEVWDALTNPEKTKIYMFGCAAISEWTPGSSLNWNAIVEGKEMCYVKGHIVKNYPPIHLSYTVFDPNSTMEDKPENYLTVTYDLEKISDDVTLFKVTQGDYSLVDDGERRYNESYNHGDGWNPILIAVKNLVEAK